MMKNTIIFLALILSISLASADILSINSAGSGEIVVVSNDIIEGFFFKEVPSATGGSYNPGVDGTKEVVDTSDPEINTLGEIFSLFSILGGKVWQGSPRAGLLILTFLIFIILLLLIFNKDKIKILKDMPVYLSILFWIVVLLTSFFVSILLFVECEVNLLGDVKQCINNFNSLIWPGSSFAGLLLYLLVVTIFFFLIFIYKRRKKKNPKI